MAIDKNIQDGLNRTIAKLSSVMGKVRVNVKPELSEGAHLLVAAIKGRAPISSQTHKRYKDGRVVAIYRPGNMRRSFKTLKFRRSKAVFVGPKLGGNPDGYYSRFVEFGTVHQPAQGFVKAGVDAVGGIALRVATEAIKRKIEKLASK